MVQNVIHRLYVLLLILSDIVARKREDARWFSSESLLAIVKGCSLKFFPCSGNGNGSSWNNCGGNGYYWSASFNSARNARNLNFNSGGVNPQNNNNRYNGFAVRAVQHTLLTFLFLLLIGCCSTATYGTNVTNGHDTDSSATLTRPVSGLLRCEASQVEAVLCEGLGEESQGEHGTALRRFVLQEIQAPAVEMLHHRLPQEEGDIRCHLPRQDCAPFILQLHSWPIRKNVHSGHIQLHQGPRYALWHQPHNGLLQERESQLATEVLRDALRHQGLLYAHCTEETFGDCRWLSEKDGFAQDRQLWYNRKLDEDLGRGAGYGLCDLADGSDSDAGPEGELHHLWRPVGLGWSGPCQEHASLAGRSWPAHRQLDKSAILECLYECVRPILQTRAEMSLLRQICGRCSYCLGRQGMAIITGSEDTSIPESGAWAGVAHGQAGNLGGASWRRVLRSLHQALQDVYLESRLGTHQDEDCRIRLYEALEGDTERQQLFRHIPAHGIVQSIEKAIDDERHTEARSIRSGHDKIHRQKTIL